MSPVNKHVSIHIFYNVPNLRPLLVECVDPLLVRLHSAGLISSYFFIRYWMGGPHVRLRLLPSPGVERHQLTEIVGPMIETYLRTKPSLFGVDARSAGPFMRKMFEAEYGKEAYEKQYGNSGGIRIFPTNSFEYVDYEPEYARYGGPRGVELAEQHFRVSSSVALSVLRKSNSRIGSVLLGQALQLMFHFARAIYPNLQDLRKFFFRYASFWQRAYGDGFDLNEGLLDQGYARQSQKFKEYMVPFFKQTGSIAYSSNDPFREWATHAAKMASDLNRLYEEQSLAFVPAAQSQQEALHCVVTSCVHMTNNRLGIVIPNEIYLASLLSRCLEDISHS
jgi:thiopeptide-type bacteriocin biosynthesis protein